MNNIDLHIHSIHSGDGELLVKELIQQCISSHIDLFSITDHNSVKATEEAYRLSKESGLNFIPGIEIDCQFKGVDLHLLGYQIDWTSSDFMELEEITKRRGLDSLPQMISNLAGAGIEIDLSEVIAKSEGKMPNGELFAEILLGNDRYGSNPLLNPYREGGHRSDMPYINFYLDYFAQGRPAHVAMEHMDYADALELVRSNQGIPVVAHPGLNFRGKEEMVVQLLDLGAAGLEVFNNYHDVTQMDYFASLVQEKQKLATCGSDFHGKNKPLIRIGEYRFHEQYKEYVSESVNQLLRENPNL